MKKAVKFIGWTLASLVMLGLVAAFGANVLAERKLNRTIDVQAAAVAFVSDEASLVRGKYLFESRGCSECHGADGAGRPVIDEPNGLRV